MYMERKRGHRCKRAEIGHFEGCKLQ